MKLLLGILLQALIMLHGPDQQAIYINPYTITSLREPRPSNRHQFAKGTQCVVVMTNTNIIAVQDDCATVRRQIELTPKQ